jgi:hypothetical protein
MRDDSKRLHERRRREAVRIRKTPKNQELGAAEGGYLTGVTSVAPFSTTIVSSTLTGTSPTLMPS